MPLQRVLEPEVMDTPAEARTYDAMDHREVNQRFVADLIRAVQPHLPLTRVLDLGTGTALIPIELCRQHADVAIVATDLAASMIEVARANVQRARLQARIELVLSDAKRLKMVDNQFPLVISNSIVHHIPEPIWVLQEAVRVAGQGVFFRDLMRPDSERQLQNLVTEYASGESAHAQSMFEDSLRAALSLDEIRELVSSLGLSAEAVTATSDRHWTWFALVAENRVHP